MIIMYNMRQRGQSNTPPHIPLTLFYYIKRGYQMSSTRLEFETRCQVCERVGVLSCVIIGLCVCAISLHRRQL